MPVKDQSSGGFNEHSPSAIIIGEVPIIAAFVNLKMPETPAQQQQKQQEDGAQEGQSALNLTKLTMEIKFRHAMAALSSEERHVVSELRFSPAPTRHQPINHRAERGVEQSLRQDD
jgi:hypothetical protein